MRSAATFLKIGENPTAIKLSDIQQIAGGPGDLVLCLYDNNVTRQAQYMYISDEVVEGSEGYFPNAGWYKVDDSLNPINPELGAQGDVDLPYGQGCVINSSSSEAVYTSAGEVDSIVREFSIASGARKMMGNVLPRTLMLSELKQISGGPGDLVFCTYDNNVTRQAQYMYISDEVVTGSEGYFPNVGWYKVDDSLNPINPELGAQDLEIPSGDGFVVNSSNSEAMLQFPKALQ